MQKTESRGKPLTCKYCGYSFKIIDIEEKKIWRENKNICPSCKEEWCDKPPTERSLISLQDQYLFTRRENDFVNYLRVMYSYTQAIIKKKYSKRLTFEGALEYHSNEAITFLVMEYLNRTDFKISDSFSGYIEYKITQSLNSKKDRIDQHISFDYEFEDGNNLHELIASDYHGDLIYEIEQNEDTLNLFNKMIGLIEGASEFCEDAYEDHIRVISIYLYVVKGELAFDKIFQAFGRKGKERAMKTLEMIRNELKKETILKIKEDTKKEATKKRSETLLHLKPKPISW